MDDLGIYTSVNIKGLIERVFDNPGTSILKIPFNTFYNLLRMVAKRCSELNDPRLNELMLRLNMYDVSNEERVKLIKQMVELQEVKK